MVTVALAVVVRTRKPLSTQSTKYVRSLKASYVPVTDVYKRQDYAGASRGVEDAAPYKVCAVGDRATKPGACMALATRKGHAASVRRQSRQRLRSERRYRRNRCVPF